MTMSIIFLLIRDPAALSVFIRDIGQPSYRFVQLMSWLYQKNAEAFEQAGPGARQPMVIETPVYVEGRITMEVANREIETVFIGEMVSRDDCEHRSRRMLENLFEGCLRCEIRRLQCRDSLEKRYLRLFNDRATHTTYVSMNRGNRWERNGRMVVWGLTDHESRLMCETAKKTISEKYKGTVKCVGGRLS